LAQNGAKYQNFENTVIVYNSLINFNSTREFLNILLIIVLFNRTGRYFRDKRAEINELATNSKNKSIKYLHRGINEFKWGF
jgi:hypothetical protein